MRATQVSATIGRAHSINRPLMVWGPPGSGKSSLFRDYAHKMGLTMVDWRLTLMDPVDMRGTPREKDGLTYWAPPAELPRDGKGIILLDELPQAKMDTKNVAAMLVLERRIGEYRLPAGWWIAAAGNRMQDASGTTPMPQHLNNRFWHISLDMSNEDWLAWAEEHEIDYRVYAYIKYRPAALLEFDPRSKDPSFPTPRSWELLSDIVKDLDKAGSAIDAKKGLMVFEPALLAELFGGAVGSVRGNEFAGFLNTLHSLVDIDTVFASPTAAMLPDDPSICYALMGALAVAAKRETLAAAVIYAARLPGEFSVLLMHSIQYRNALLMKSKAYIELAAKFAPKL